MRRVLTLIGTLVAGALLVLGAASARADIFEATQLVSAGPLQQADYAHHPAISADGRYVAFDGSFGGVQGVWRRDLITGAVAAVVTCGEVQQTICAELPSVSSDGRYVTFTTTLALDPRNDTNVAPDVYVRDMNSGTPCSLELGEGERCEYELASARNGSTAGLAYSYTGSNAAFEETHDGAIAAGRSALTADGRHVAFVTTAESDLAGEHTPKLQVAMRDLDAHTTRLVSARYDRENGRMTEEPVPQGAGGVGAAYPGATELPAFGTSAAAFAGASISADGSTVAWMGQEIEKQAPLLAAEPNVSPGYTEPLWRRIADGPLAPTRRVTGGGDPVSPACAASGETAPVSPPTLADPCQGPFDPTYVEGAAGIWVLGGIVGDYLPRLSGDGRVLAFLSSAREVASGEAFRAAEASNDIYVVDMRDGLTRVQSLRRLTELAGGSTGEPARTAPIVDLNVSPDGSQVAFTTQRTVFPLGSPAYVSAPASEVGIVALYDVDLANDTLTRVTEGFRGEAAGPAGAVTNSPSFSADGNALAFASTAGNLVYGDGNSRHGELPPLFDGGDAFVARRKVIAPNPAQTYVSPAPAGPLLAPAWRLGVTPHSRRDGSVLLDVLVPGAGTLNVHADGAVRVQLASRAAKRGRRHRRPPTAVAVRRIANGVSRASRGGLVELPLALARPYRSLASRRGGLSATALLTFEAPGHAAVRASIDVSFVRVVKAHHRARKAPHGRAKTRGRRR